MVLPLFSLVQENINVPIGRIIGFVPEVAIKKQLIKITTAATVVAQFTEPHPRKW